MYKNIKKFYPRYNENDIKKEIENFNKIYEVILNEVKNIVYNILEKDKDKSEKDIVLEKLSKEFPGYSIDLILALKNEIDNINTESKIEELVDDLVNIKTKNYLMSYDYIKKEDVSIEFLRTIKSIGVIDIVKGIEIELKDKYEKPRNNPSYANYNHNYKDYIGKKLLLTENEIDKISLESLDSKIMPFLELAINHVRIVFDGIKGDNGDDLKSIYFESIHNQGKNITYLELFKLYYKLEIEKRKINKKGLNKSYISHLKQIEIGQFEIQRIIALSTLYINRENTLTFQNAEEEQNFLIGKLAELGTPEMKEYYLDTSIQVDNLLYNYTKKSQLYWISTGKGEDKKYIISEEKIKGFKKINLDSFEIEGKTRNYKKNKEKIKLLHVGSRIKKNPFSSIEKFLRKGLTSFNQILDHKGFIFVVDNFDKDLDLLKKILEYEWGTLKTSWLEENQSMKIIGNENTSTEYNSMKGILKVNYKGKLIRDFFNYLSEIFDINNLTKAKNQLKLLMDKNINEISLEDINTFISKVDNKNVYKLYNDFQERFGNKKYFMEVEIQVFDKENFIKAEIDEDSPAYHGKYKELQRIQTLAIYFPKEIYGDNIKKILLEEIPKIEKYKFLDDNNE